MDFSSSHVEDGADVGVATAEEPALGEQEFEVEDILRYRRNEDGAEYFLVKWVGFSPSEATWEPIEHMNDNCRELIAKARALFAWRRPGGQFVASREDHADVDLVEDHAEVPHASSGDVVQCSEFRGDTSRVSSVSALPPGFPLEELAGDNDDDILIDDGECNDHSYTDCVPDSFKRNAGQAPDTAVGAAPSKRQKLQAASLGTQSALGSAAGAQGKRPAGVSNGMPPRFAGATPVPPPTPPPAPTPPPTPPPRGGGGQGDDASKPKEMKCICGSSEKLLGSYNRGAFIVCKVCNCALHPTCVEGSLSGQQMADDFVCPPCRLERVDEFHPPVGPGLLRHNYASCSSTLSLTFNSQATQWRKQQWAVHLRAVQLNSLDLGGPAWPHRVQGKLNGRQCVAIDPPKHLHIRREQCYNLTPLLRQGVNTLELKFSPKPDKPRDEPEDAYCVGVVLTRPRSVASIIARIRTRSTETVSSGRSRVERLLAQVAEHEAHQDECKVTGNFGRTLKPLCPVSHCPIEEAAIGRICNHVQVFDLQAYIAVNQRMRSLDKRWTCPVCSLALRPDDVILDPFAQGILDTLRGDEDLVEAIVFNQDCSWETISAVKDDKERQGPDDEAQSGGGPAAELIDLSDSE